MESNRHTAYDKLFYKVATNSFSLDYLDEIQAFYPPYLGNEVYDQIKSGCDSLRSTMYFVNNMPDKSLEIDLDLLKNTSDDSSYYTVVGRAAKTSEELGRTDEVVNFAVQFLKNQEDNWSGKLPVLAWYVKYYPTGEEGSFIGFEQLLSDIVEAMGANVNPLLSFIDRVNYLYGEFLRASKDLRAFQVTYKKAPLEEKNKVLSDYLEKETVEFYRNTVIEHHKNW